MMLPASGPISYWVTGNDTSFLHYFKNFSYITQGPRVETLYVQAALMMLNMTEKLKKGPCTIISIPCPVLISPNRNDQISLSGNKCNVNTYKVKGLPVTFHEKEIHLILNTLWSYQGIHRFLSDKIHKYFSILPKAFHNVGIRKKHTWVFLDIILHRFIHLIKQYCSQNMLFKCKQ